MDEANDCKTENAGAGGVEVWSLERYELEKQKELLVILMKKLERYELEKQKKLLIILKKTLPYWKNWKKTERLQALVECEIFYLNQKPQLVDRPHRGGWRRASCRRGRRTCN